MCFRLRTTADLKPVDDLMVYKKSLKNRMAGFRWSYANDTNVDGFVVSYDGKAFKKAKNVSLVPPTKCSAWPDHYCHTFYNMTPSNAYTFQVGTRRTTAQKYENNRVGKSTTRVNDSRGDNILCFCVR